MITSVQLWGNSLAIRIPKIFAQQIDLVANTEVEIEVIGRKLVIRPARREWTLEELLAGVTDANRHPEAPWGDAVGNEAW
ncbi:MAG: AbrB/MazE/SpoVT family DNA-binding domain-containing protein [Gemmatimonadaceae bacterium]